MLFISVIRDFKNLGFQRVWTELYCAWPTGQNQPQFWGSQRQMTSFSRPLDFFKPRPLPPLICSDRSMLCFRYTFSEYFLGLAPLLYCTTPPSQHISFALGRFVIIRAHDGASHSNSAQGTCAKQTGFQIATLEACPLSPSPAPNLASLSGKVQITWQGTWNFNCEQLKSSYHFCFRGQASDSVLFGVFY